MASFELVTSIIPLIAGAAKTELYQQLKSLLMRQLGGEKIAEIDDIGTLIAQAERAEKKEDPITALSEANFAIVSARASASAALAERQRQAKWTFNLAALLLAVGSGAVILGGILLIFTDRIAAGALTSGAGAITDIFSAILFVFYKDANNRLDEAVNSNRVLATAELATDIAAKIEVKETRDATLQKIASELGTRPVVARKSKST